MNWLVKFFNSSIGQKLLMSLTGLFLCTFLVIHLMGNLQLLKGDNGEAFNAYTYFMTHNPLIKTVSYLLYFSILLHAVKGIMIWKANRDARGGHNYQKNYTNNTSWASRQMALLGTIMLVFIIIHMKDFWYVMKFGQVEMVTIKGHEGEVKNLYKIVEAAFSQMWYVVLYVLSMVVIGFHLWHGFASAFQTLGINHKKYTPIIKFIGFVFSIIVPLGFALIPIIMLMHS